MNTQNKINIIKVLESEIVQNLFLVMVTLDFFSRSASVLGPNMCKTFQKHRKFLLTVDEEKW